jgi:hypothetical protein
MKTKTRKFGEVPDGMTRDEAREFGEGLRNLVRSYVEKYGDLDDEEDTGDEEEDFEESDESTGLEKHAMDNLGDDALGMHSDRGKKGERLVRKYMQECVANDAPEKFAEEHQSSVVAQAVADYRRAGSPPVRDYLPKPWLKAQQAN